MPSRPGFKNDIPANRIQVPDDKVAASEKWGSEISNSHVAVRSLRHHWKLLAIANISVAKCFHPVRLAEEVAAANFRQTQDKIEMDLDHLKTYYQAKQDAADRAVA